METDGDSYKPPDESDDEITIDFPTELISDEYEHDNNSSGLVYVFQDDKSQTQRFHEKILDSINHHEYNVPEENVVSVKDTNDFLNELNERSKEDFTKISCLIVFLIGDHRIFGDLLKSDVTAKIWSPFINNNSLKYKPKIFILYQYDDSAITTDGFAFAVKDQSYDIPTEADVLIVYQKSAVVKKNIFGFLGKFCENVKDYGIRDDIMGLIIRTQCNPRPLTISTLRKKFFISSSDHREHIFDIMGHSNRVLGTLKSLQTRIAKISKSRKTPYPASGDVEKSDSKSDKSPAKVPKSMKNLTVADGPSRKKASSTSSLAKKDKDKPDSRKIWKY
ncbi:hypothetical protein Trydic_g16514 [Trypoxylus dichotomus]